jgi:hypothetical protein
MTTFNSNVRARFRTHFIAGPEKREGDDRRKINCYISKDRRSGIACRRRERQREIEFRVAASKVRFYPEYARLI